MGITSRLGECIYHFEMYGIWLYNISICNYIHLTYWHTQTQCDHNCIFDYKSFVGSTNETQKVTEK